MHVGLAVWAGHKWPANVCSIPHSKEGKDKNCWWYRGRWSVSLLKTSGEDASKPQEQTVRWRAPRAASCATESEEKATAHRETTQWQVPVGPCPPSTLHLFHSSQLSIKINSLVFHGLASIYLGQEDTHRFVAAPESPCSTFLISEQSNQTR